MKEEDDNIEKVGNSHLLLKVKPDVARPRSKISL